MFLIDRKATENSRNTRDNTFPSYDSEEFLFVFASCEAMRANEKIRKHVRTKRGGFLAAVHVRDRTNSSPWHEVVVGSRLTIYKTKKKMQKKRRKTKKKKNVVEYFRRLEKSARKKIREKYRVIRSAEFSSSNDSSDQRERYTPIFPESFRAFDKLLNRPIIFLLIVREARVFTRAIADTGMDVSREEFRGGPLDQSELRQLPR